MFCGLATSSLHDWRMPCHLSSGLGFLICAFIRWELHDADLMKLGYIRSTAQNPTCERALRLGLLSWVCYGRYAQGMCISATLWSSSVSAMNADELRRKATVTTTNNNRTHEETTNIPKCAIQLIHKQFRFKPRTAQKHGAWNEFVCVLWLQQLCMFPPCSRCLSAKTRRQFSLCTHVSVRWNMPDTFLRPIDTRDFHLTDVVSRSSSSTSYSLGTQGS